MTESAKQYDLNGINGAQTFRELPEGLKLKLEDGTIGEIVGNPGDGAFVLLKILESPSNPARIGAEEAVFFTDVAEVLA